jgi:hypothetical protein
MIHRRAYNSSESIQNKNFNLSFEKVLLGLRSKPFVGTTVEENSAKKKKKKKKRPSDTHKHTHRRIHREHPLSFPYAAWNTMPERSCRNFLVKTAWKLFSNLRPAARTPQPYSS